jgi:two-component system, repressor protein LuxO
MGFGQATNSPVSQRKPGLVLVIDDEVDLLDTYARFLRRMGYDVVTAERGHAGLSIAESREIALVIVDLRLPDMDGLEVVRALNGRPDPPPIIVVTGFASPVTRQAALGAGAAAFLTKPFSVLALASVLRNVQGDVRGPDREA